MSGVKPRSELTNKAQKNTKTLLTNSQLLSSLLLEELRKMPISIRHMRKLGAAYCQIEQPNVTY